MKLKYVIQNGQMTVGLRFDTDKEEVMIGGSNTTVSFVWGLILDVFGIPSREVETNKAGSGKTRFTFELSLEDVHQGLKEIEESGIQCSLVKTFGRLVW